MWIVRLALARPYTFIVLALLILILAPIVILRTPTDIFPNIDIPVIAAAFNYNGLSAEEMEERITSIYERSLTTTVNDIEHISFRQALRLPFCLLTMLRAGGGERLRIKRSPPMM